PGWHIECSTMSMRYLRTQTLDVHAGGRDLIFPHHENEIAQAEALTGKQFAKYWIHHGLLTIDGRKMSKSLGNFVTIQDILAKFSSDVLKVFFLSAHYGSPIDFTFEALTRSKKAYEKMEEFLDKCSLEQSKSKEEGNLEGSLKSDIDLKRKTFEDVMDDDFNTAKGLAVLFDIVNSGNRMLDSRKKDGALYAARQLTELVKVYGLGFKNKIKTYEFSRSERVKISGPLPSGLDQKEIERLLEDRRIARKAKDFKKADEIRDYLKKNGIVVEDTERS
ncbi:MAG TPA: class I tRNA ligase family protein, partial [Candidatus Omnitrophota bacterium]|nr:class I tRNA ligase family protein [Candidatus Omnitrophota bacterium]